MKAPRIKPGDPIRWRHFHLDGTITIRQGTVVDRAPRVLEGEAGVTKYGVPFAAQHMNWWVKPDQSMPDDIYHTLAVGWARRDTYAHGRCWTDTRGPTTAYKDQLFSSDDPRSPLGMLAHRAALDAAKNRNG